MFMSQYAPMHLTLFNESIEAENEVRRHVFNDVQKQVASMMQEHSEPRNPLTNETKNSFTQLFNNLTSEIDKQIQKFYTNQPFQDLGDIPLIYNRIAILIDSLTPSLIGNAMVDTNSMITKMDGLVNKLRLLVKMAKGSLTDEMVEVLKDILNNIISRKFDEVDVKVDYTTYEAQIVKSKTFQDSLKQLNELINDARNNDKYSNITEANIQQIDIIAEKANVIREKAQPFLVNPNDVEIISSKTMAKYASEIDKLSSQLVVIINSYKTKDFVRKTLLNDATLFLQDTVRPTQDFIQHLNNYLLSDDTQLKLNKDIYKSIIYPDLTTDNNSCVFLDASLKEMINEIARNPDINLNDYATELETTKKTFYEKVFKTYKEIQKGSYSFGTKTNKTFYKEIINPLLRSLNLTPIAETIEPEIVDIAPVANNELEPRQQEPVQPSIAVEEALLNPADALVLKTPSKKTITIKRKEKTPTKAKEQSALETPEQKAKRERAEARQKKRDENKEGNKLSESETIAKRKEIVNEILRKQEEVRQKRKEKGAEAQQEEVVNLENLFSGEGKPKRRIGKGRKKTNKPVMKQTSAFMRYLDTDDKLLPNLPKKIVPYGL